MTYIVNMHILSTYKCTLSLTLSLSLSLTPSIFFHLLLTLYLSLYLSISVSLSLCFSVSLCLSAGTPLSKSHPPCLIIRGVRGTPLSYFPHFFYNNEYYSIWFGAGRSCTRYLRSKICFVCRGIISFQMRIEWFYRTKFDTHLIFYI